MAVVSRVTLLASDISGEADAATFEIDPGSVLRDIAKSFPKITIDVTDAEGEDIVSEGEAAFEAVRAALTEAYAYLYEIKASLTAAGAKTSGGAASKASTGKASTKAPNHSEAIRSWARSMGIEVGDRGVIKADVVRQYHEALNSLPSVETPASWFPDGDGDVVTTDGPTDAELLAMIDEDATA